MVDGERTILLLACGLAFYTLGASAIEGQVNYRTWRLIGADSFVRYHRAVGTRILFMLVAPFGVGVLLMLGLAFRRPPGIPLWSVLASLALDLVAVAATLRWQLPAQRELDRTGWSAELIEQLVRREWFRLVPHLVNAVLLLWLVGRMVTREGTGA